MDQTDLSSSQKETVLSLLDDPSPTVHRGLRDHLIMLGPPAITFLRQLAAGHHRAYAWHARAFLEELQLSDPIGEFRTFIRSLNYELETGALLLARTVRPDLDVGRCCEKLDAMAARCRELMIEPASAREKCRVINRVLYHEYGFHGNIEHYTDPDNSLIDQLLARQKGIPLSLSLLYLLVADRIGLELEPVGLPGHFMVGCFMDDSPFFIDAFDGGYFRSPEEVFLFLKNHKLAPSISDLAPTSVREVLCRACRNLANHYAEAGDTNHADLFTSFVNEFESTYARNTA
mgnify:CR=1 FL=1